MRSPCPGVYQRLVRPINVDLVLLWKVFGELQGYGHAASYSREHANERSEHDWGTVFSAHSTFLPEGLPLKPCSNGLGNSGSASFMLSARAVGS